RGRCVVRLAFSPDGKLLASGDEDGQVCLWDGRSGEATRTLDGHAQWVSGVGFSSDGKTLVSGSHDKTVKLWDVGSGKLQMALAGQEGPVTALAFSPDGRLLATVAAGDRDQPGGRNIKVLLWDTTTWEPTRVCPDQTAEVESLAFSPDGNVLALGGGDRVPGGGADTPAEGRPKTPREVKLCKLKLDPRQNEPVGNSQIRPRCRGLAFSHKPRHRSLNWLTTQLSSRGRRATLYRRTVSGPRLVERLVRPGQVFLRHTRAYARTGTPAGWGILLRG